MTASAPSVLRLVFAGTPATAVPTLRRLMAGPHDVAAVVTRRPAPVGRRHVLTPSPVATAVDGPRLLEANRLDDAVTAEIGALRPDLGVIVAYGGLVREPLLSLPRLGWINLHFSLLPAWRGAAPVQRAIMAGDTVTGASVFQLVAALDAGDVYARLRREIGADETADQVLEALSHSGAELTTEVVDALAQGTARAAPQSGAVSEAPKLSAEDGRIDWSRPASEVYARIRGVTSEPGAFTTVDGARLKILAAARAEDASLAAGQVTADGRRVLVGTTTEPLELVTVQPAGKRAMPAVDWWRGRSGRPARAQ